MSYLWGFDLGGTKIEGVILDPLYNVIARLRVPTEAHLGYDHVLQQIARLHAELIVETRLPMPDRLGIGTPGSINPKSRLLRGSNVLCLNDKRIGEDLEDLLDCEVRLAHDANCFALAEATLGAAKGYPTVFGVILGTGVGGGLVVEQKLLAGCNGIAGDGAKSSSNRTARAHRLLERVAPSSR